jgi:hypothetical protein
MLLNGTAQIEEYTYILVSVWLPLVWPLCTWNKEARNHPVTTLRLQPMKMDILSLSDLVSVPTNEILLPYGQMQQLWRIYIRKKTCVKWRLIAQTVLCLVHVDARPISVSVDASVNGILCRRLGNIILAQALYSIGSNLAKTQYNSRPSRHSTPVIPRIRKSMS